MKRKNIVIIILVLSVLVGGISYYFAKIYYLGNVKKEGYLLIYHDSKVQEVMKNLLPYLKNVEDFQKVAKQQNFEKNIKPGRYHLSFGQGNFRLVKNIVLGRQTPNTFRIKDFGSVYQMIGRITKKTEIDSVEFVQKLDEIAQKEGLKNAEGLKFYFLMDTYDFYWTVTPEYFFKTFKSQYEHFWNTERIQKQKKIGLSRNEIYTLASIVLKESGGMRDEQTRIAGLYLNRLRKGKKLQSDPTVIYAVNLSNNFHTIIKRVYFKDLEINSPYNTYRYKGLPPSPICIVDKNSLDAVLNAEENNYLFMCADPHHKGFHKFTADEQEHMQNAKEYREWLNENKIK